MRHALEQEGWNLDQLIEEEPDAGLGNGGLGRLAACFIDSLATLQYPAIGYGLRYEYGIFRQSIRDGWQREQPDNWLRNTDPWEVVRPGKVYAVPLNCTFEMRGGNSASREISPPPCWASPYDRPVVGYGALASTPCVFGRRRRPTLSILPSSPRATSPAPSFKTSPPNRSPACSTRTTRPRPGGTLRFLQQYFMVSCSLQDIIAPLSQDTARQLVDAAGPRGHPAERHAPGDVRCRADANPARPGEAAWDQAWDITLRTLAYTNHTLLPEALERWPVELFEVLIPRHLELIYEINRCFLDDVRRRYPGDEPRLQRMSLIEEGPTRRVRMAHLAVVGSHSTNGVAAIHSDLLRSLCCVTSPSCFPCASTTRPTASRPRRWLQQANPSLSRLSPRRSANTGSPTSPTSQSSAAGRRRGFREQFRVAKREAKVAFANWLKASLGRRRPRLNLRQPDQTHP